MEQAATNPVSAMEQESVPSKYQVFINHRGTDVKKTLASYIYHRLRNVHGLTVFLDNKELHAGDTLSPAIQGAIKSASVNITIFSRRYAESRWCLDELCWILECKRHKQHTKIIPVFYDVQPSDLRSIDREPYAEAFEDHRRQNRDIEKWTTALNEASNIVGAITTNTSDDQGLLLERIVKAVRTEIFKWEALEETTVPLVGMEQAVKDLENAMTRIKSNDIAIVGIAGMAGLGKSTLVRHYYTSKCLDYSKSCFLKDIGKSKYSLYTLQKQLLSDLLSHNNDIHHHDTRKGKSLLRNGLKLSRVLIVFDDVHEVEQVNSLLDIYAVGRGSLILITSCDQEVLRLCCRGARGRPSQTTGRSSQTTNIVWHKVKPLQEKDALELFCEYAFNQNKPKDGFRDLMDDVLKICGGLPLSLKLLGEELSDNSDESSWKSKLKTCSRKLPKSIIKKLKLWYEDLDLSPEERSIFLDIGCFFVGEDKDLSVRVLEGFDYDDVCYCLEILRKKCLVEYLDDVESRNDHSDNPNRSSPEEREKITMHNQTRVLARHIVGEEAIYGSSRSKPIRLSCSDHTQKMLQLKGEAASCRIRGNEILRASNCGNKIKGVGVHLFVIENPIDLSKFFGLVDMEGGLVWLRLCKVVSIFFPSTISLTELRVLELEGLHGDVEQLLDRFIDPPSELRELSIKVTDTLPCTSTSRKALNTDRNITDSALQAETATSSSLFRFLNWIGTSMTLLNRIELKNIPSLQSQRIFMPRKIELEKLSSLSLGINFSELKDLSYLDISGSQTVETLP